MTAQAGHRLSNDDIAGILERVADLLETQHANPYRVRAYRHAADTIRTSELSIAELAGDPGAGRLEALPGIGASLASAIRELVAAGRLALLERLEGQVSPEDLFCTLPGVGEALARRAHLRLGVETLEELELAAHDGRLEQVPGFGRRRTQALREILAGILSRSARRRARLIAPRAPDPAPPDRPSVGTLLGTDREYRRLAGAGRLRRIAPRRFNPERRAWLPIFHTEMDGWVMTALFSNTARAHALGTTRDWVIVYYERDGHEGQCTIVTERHGPQAGRRVVRGREAECAAVRCRPRRTETNDDPEAIARTR